MSMTWCLALPTTKSAKFQNKHPFRLGNFKKKCVRIYDGHLHSYYMKLTLNLLLTQNILGIKIIIHSNFLTDKNI